MSGQRDATEAVESIEGDLPETRGVMPGRRPSVRRVWAAVNETERRICGAGAAHSASVAEGMALIRKRAAGLIPVPGESSPRPPLRSAAAPRVDHRVVPGQPAEPGSHAFELAATEPQQAVDHCLVAHEMAARLGRPGLCTIHRRLADAVAPVVLAERAWIDALSPVALGRAGEPTREELIQTARESFDKIGRVVGRKLPVVASDPMQDARYVIVAAGSLGVTATRASATLRAAGLSCGTVVPALVHPLPHHELRRALEGAQAVAVLEAADTGDLLADTVRALSDGDRDVSTVRVSGDGEGDLAERLAALWEVDLSSDAPPVDDMADGSDVRTFGAAPAGGWSEELLLDTAGWMALGGPVEVDLAQTDSSGVSVVRVAGCAGRTPAPVHGDVDVLFVAHPGILQGTRELARLREGGMVIVHGSPSAGDAATGFSQGQLRFLVERKARLGRLSVPTTRRVAIQGSLLSALAAVTGVDDIAAALAARDDLHSDDAAEVEELRSGGDALDAVDPAEQESRGAPGDLPRLPAAPAAAAADDVRGRLHHFHLTGEGEYGATDPLPALPLSPAILDAVAGTEAMVGDFPLVLLGEEDATRYGVAIMPLRTLILRVMEAGGEPYSLMPEHVERVCGLARRLLHASRGPVAFGGTIRQAFAELLRLVDHTAEAAQACGREMSRLQQALPSDASLVGPGPHALLPLYDRVVVEHRRGHRRAVARELDELHRRLGELLALQGSATGGSPATLTHALGASGSRFVDPEALSKTLSRRKGSKPMAAERHRRIERTLQTLEVLRERLPHLPELWLIRSPEIGGGELPPGQREVVHDDGLRAAIGLFDALAADAVEWFRALRTARLEVEGTYDERRHGPILDRLQWQSLTRDEFFLMPPVLVLETAKRLRGPALAAFSELLRSGRPVHVLVAESAAGSTSRETWEELSGYHPGLGYLAVAHREAFVLQSTQARGEHLVAGLGAVAESLVPSVALIEIPAPELPVPPPIQLGAALLARVTPCFVHDPSAGASWAERFRLTDNPQPESSMPSFEVTYRDEDGEARTRVESFTFAHAAALDPNYRAHFRVIGPEAWFDDQVEIGSYLELSDRQRRQALPYLWIVGEDGRLARAVMSREIVFGCLDRLRAWRILQELAGTGNVYADRAAEEARKQAEAAASERIETLAEEHAAALASAREEGATEAVDRLVRVLTDPEALARAMPELAEMPLSAAPAPAAPAETSPITEPEPEQTPEEEDDEDLELGGPYIDSVLCTTCNDCTNLNPRLFRYNANKQAEIGDPSAGTFEELVRAAEACPAKCIHPGAPRADDGTVTDRLIARAAKFN